jgi:hypothetical protein
MTIERYDEIIEYIILTIQDEMRKIFGQKLYYKRKELYNLIGHSCFCFQVYYDEEYDKFYLYYELDPLARIYDCTLATKRINGHLNSNFYRDTNHKIEIVGPVILSGPKSLPRVANHSDNVLRNNTFSYWRCFDGVYRFLEDKQRLMLDHNIYFDPNKIEEKIKKEKDFKSGINTINEKYDFDSSDNEENVKNAFGEYKKLYKDLFGMRLLPIDSNKITYVYLDAVYPDLSLFERK